MQRGNWIPLDKSFVSFLPKDRPYSEVEAALSITCDYDNGKMVTIEGYMRRWKWGKGKIYRFMKNSGFSIVRESKRGPGRIVIDRTIGDTTSGRETDAKRTQNGRPVIRDSAWLRRDTDARRTIGDTTSGRKTDDRRNTTIYPNPNPNPDKSHEDNKTSNSPNTKKQKPPSGTVNGYSDKFLTFWAAYPKKIGKAVAWKAWKKSKLDSFSEKIMLSLDAHKQSTGWTKDNGKYIPHGSTWINQQRWEDEIVEEVQQAKNTPPPRRYNGKKTIMEKI